MYFRTLRSHTTFLIRTHGSCNRWPWDVEELTFFKNQRSSYVLVYISYILWIDKEAIIPQITLVKILLVALKCDIVLTLKGDSEK